MTTKNKKIPVFTKSKAKNGNNYKKSDATRETILSAARVVFATHTYNSASLRMIAKQGGFDHAIIRYYYPSKADLFETVLVEACEKFYQSNLKCLQGLGRANPTEGFSLYIDRVIDQCFIIQDVLKLFIQNITHVDTPEAIPGYQHIPDTIEKIRISFEENIPLTAPKAEVEIFVYSFTNLLINYLGANTCMSRILGMDHESKKYRKWVKDSLMFIYLPHLKTLLFYDALSK